MLSIVIPNNDLPKQMKSGELLQITFNEDATFFIKDEFEFFDLTSLSFIHHDHYPKGKILKGIALWEKTITYQFIDKSTAAEPGRSPLSGIRTIQVGSRDLDCEQFKEALRQNPEFAKIFYENRTCTKRVMEALLKLDSISVPDAARNFLGVLLRESDAPEGN